MLIKPLLIEEKSKFINFFNKSEQTHYPDDVSLE